MQPTQLAKVSRVRRLCADGGAREIRTSRSLSLGDIATTLGVHKSTVLRWETGTCQPKKEAALRYGRLLEKLADR